MIAADPTRREFEWPTWLLLIGIWLAWLVLVSAHATLPWPLWFVTMVLLCAWYMSFQHELTHGHPTRWAAVNRWLGLAPLAVWYPYDAYERHHLIHHNDHHLTVPGMDTECNYVPEAQMRKLGGFARWLRASQRTVLGRLVLGPGLCTVALVRLTRDELARGETHMLRAWAWHVPLLVLLLAVLQGLGIHPLEYAAVGYFAFGLAMQRSLYEHRPAPLPSQRTVINEASLFWRLLFLNNNYHVVHHMYPGLQWYRIGAVYRDSAGEFQVINGGFVLPGYGGLLTRSLVQPVDSPVLEESQAALKHLAPRQTA
jgi:fatty acid desaturase